MSAQHGGGIRTHHHRRIASFALLLLLVGCAFDDEAAPLASAPDCPRLDEIAPRTLALLGNGELTGLQSVLKNDIPIDVQRQLISSVLELISAFPDGTIDAVISLRDTAAIPELGAPLAGLMSSLRTDAGVRALDAARRMLTACSGRSLFGALAEFLREPAHVEILQRLLDLGVDLDAGLMALGVDTTSPTARDGFIALVVNISTTLTRSDFDPEVLVGDDGVLSVLGGLADPGLNEVLVLIDDLLRADGLYDPLAEVVACGLTVDTDRSLPGLLYDLVVTDPLALRVAGESLALFEGGTTEAIERVVVPWLELLSASDPVRRGLVVGLDLLLRPDVWRKAAVDLERLLSNNALGEVVVLLGALRDGACPEASK